MDIGVLCCAGRMGRAVMAEILASPDARLAGGVEVPGHPALGQDLGVLVGAEPLGLVASEDAQALVRGAGIVIDFSTPDATATHVALAAAHGTGHVIGTTGLSAPQEHTIREA